MGWTTNVADRLLSATPLQAIDWTEPSGKHQRYLIDGLTFAYSERRTVSSADGIWVGQVGTRTEAPPTAPADPVTVPDPTVEVAPQPPPLRPYQVVQSFSPAMGMASQFRAYPYALDNPPVAFAPAMGMSLPGLFVPVAPVVTVQQLGGPWAVVFGDGGDAIVTSQQLGGPWAVVSGVGGDAIVTVQQLGTGVTPQGGDAIATSQAQGTADPTPNGNAIITIQTQGGENAE